eukprot:c7869_g1_i1.p1 GENE.c7869_g1_i1~~c7869_g1_i1.p1  ORF type:complete len:139 (+),score=52.84 c7869_g1_i1:28-417(+)
MDIEETGTEPTTTNYENGNIFAKILRGEIPCNKVYEDEQCLAFHDINPQAKKHILIIPKAQISQLRYATTQQEQLLGHLMVVASKIALTQGMTGGYRIVVNDGKLGCQSVYHLHLHLIGGQQLTWPPGC